MLHIKWTKMNKNMLRRKSDKECNKIIALLVVGLGWFLNSFLYFPNVLL